MADVLFIAVMVAFFGLALGLVRFCDRIIGGDDEMIVEAGDHTDETETVAA